MRTGITLALFACRFLSKNCSAIIQVEVARPVCLECYQDCKELGRITLREGGNTVAAGLVTKVGLLSCRAFL